MIPDVGLEDGRKLESLPSRAPTAIAGIATRIMSSLAPSIKTSVAVAIMTIATTLEIEVAIEGCLEESWM